MRWLVLVVVCAVHVLAQDKAVELWKAAQIRIDTGSSRPHIVGRVVGGREVSISEYPYQLSLRYNGEHICGASIIGSRLAISAAHCVSPKPPVKSITFKAGCSNITDKAGVIFNVEQIIIHPSYTTSTSNNDVALFRTIELMIGYANVASIPVASVPISITTTTPTYCVVTGWGLTDSNDSQLPDILRMVKVPLVPSTSCQQKWGPYPITSSMVCAGEPNKDSCNGDSGGPLVCNNKLYGIVSWGPATCGSAVPGVYTSLTASAIQSFIKQYMV